MQDASGCRFVLRVNGCWGGGERGEDAVVGGVKLLRILPAAGLFCMCF